MTNCANIYPQVNEGTTSYYTVNFFDKDGVLQVPTSIQYRVDCNTTDTEMLAWTNFPGVASTIEIEIDSTVSVIVDELNASEEREITVEATYGIGADKVTDSMLYTLKNMNGI